MSQDQITKSQELYEDRSASRMELEWLRKELVVTRVSHATERRYLRLKLKVSQAEAVKAPALDRRVKELEQELGTIKSFANMRPQVHGEATRPRKELDGTKQLNTRRRKENSSICRCLYKSWPEDERAGWLEANKAALARSTGEGAGGTAAVGVHLHPAEVARAKAAVEVRRHDCILEQRSREPGSRVSVGVARTWFPECAPYAQAEAEADMAPSCGK
ncbi:hypothetical protein DOTSEDRAFT_30821 [Dothistroma septosporum NZE10]|uniref:Uncharacterized protein n=1 Tax=Dothistroma septosporum (strain NZE10 / CBS 128990) TaxID=675120 RepID=N1Q4C2_DOTSN|nr:hypothetical protein DOTSEDRAFT_30821 [Dothistroma septosporum NZE10]